MANLIRLTTIPEGEEDENINALLPLNAAGMYARANTYVKSGGDLYNAILYLLENNLVNEANKIIPGDIWSEITNRLIRDGNTLYYARLYLANSSAMKLKSRPGSRIGNIIEKYLNMGLIDAAVGVLIDVILRKFRRYTGHTGEQQQEINKQIAYDRRRLYNIIINKEADVAEKEVRRKYIITDELIEGKRKEIRDALKADTDPSIVSKLFQKNGLLIEKRQLIISVMRGLKDMETKRAFLEKYGINPESVNISLITAAPSERPPGGSPGVSPLVNRYNTGEVAAAVSAAPPGASPLRNLTNAEEVISAAAPAAAPVGPPGVSPRVNRSNAGEVTPAAAAAANSERIERLLKSAAPSYPTGIERDLPPEVKESPLETYNRISSLIDRIDLDGPSVVNSVSRNATRNIPSLRQRDQRRGWIGPKESQSSYAKFLKDVLLTRQRELYANPNVSSSRNPYIETIKRLARVPKSSPSAVFNAFKAWRDVTISSITDTKLKDAISEVRAPGWFGVSKNYIPTILNLVKHYEEGLSYVPPTPPVRRNAWRLRGFTRKAAPVPKQAAAPESAPIQKPHEALPGVPVVLTQDEYNRRQAAGQAAGLAGGARRTRKIAAPRRMAHKHSRSCRHRRQRGGATPMPLAYYQPGAYETRTLDATGAGIAGTSGAWIREPVTQTGGRRRMTHKHRRQAGGFTPSVMGQFASAGLRLLPVAGYMGYKLFNKKSRKASRKAGRRTRRR